MDIVQAQAENKATKAQAENDLSQASAKAGPFTLSSSGAVAQDNSDRTEGSWNQTIGSAKEFVGNAVGAEGLKQEGIQQNRDGKAQEAQGQLSDLGQGIADRAKGTIGGAMAGVLGDTNSQKAFQDQHDKGKSLQRGAEIDITKQADAEAQAANKQ